METVIKSAEQSGTDTMPATTDYVSAATDNISYKMTDDNSALFALNSACTDAFDMHRFSLLS